jgi:hypothetical protein
MDRPLPPRPDRPLPARTPARPLPPRQQAHPVTRPTTPPRKPDPRPMRVVYGASSLAALSALTVSLSHPSPPADLPEVAFDTSLSEPAPATTPPPVEVRHLINYVHLLPGQTAPPGATVITPDAPAPLIVITTLPAPTTVVGQTAQRITQTKPKRRVKTHQSGTP